MAMMNPLDAEESAPRTEQAGSVVEASWGALRLDLGRVREITSEEDGLFDSEQGLCPDQSRRDCGT